MASVPSRQRPGGNVRKTQPTETPRSSPSEKKPARMGITPNGGTHRRGKGQK